MSARTRVGLSVSQESVLYVALSQPPSSRSRVDMFNVIVYWVTRCIDGLMADKAGGDAW